MKEDVKKAVNVVMQIMHELEKRDVDQGDIPALCVAVAKVMVYNAILEKEEMG